MGATEAWNPNPVHILTRKRMIFWSCKNALFDIAKSECHIHSGFPDFSGSVTVNMQTFF